MGELASAVESFRQWLDEDESRGEVTLSVSCEWLGGAEVAVEVGRHTVKADEPKRLGGGSTAPNPVGYLMASLGSCVVMGLSYWSDILEVPFDSAHVVVEGDIHPGGAYGIGGGPTFSELRVEIRVSGSEPDESYEELVVQMNSHSPLIEALNRPIPVSTRLEIS